MILLSDFLIDLYVKIIRKKIILIFLVTVDETEDLVPVISELSITIKNEERKKKQEKRLARIK